MDLERRPDGDDDPIQRATPPKELRPDDIRVSDSEREQVVAVLGQAAGEGRLTLDEYTDRVEQAYAARTRGELVPLLRDLPVGQGQAQPIWATPAGEAQVWTPRPAAAADRTERLLAIFGEDSRKGHWIVPAKVEVRTIFGGCELHFEDAQIQHPVTRVEATVIFGGVTLFVPEGVEVRLSGAAIFGGKDTKLRDAPRPGAPVIEVACLILFGGVEVRPPKRRWLTKE
ncbi:MAG: DUF1707 and DUF2154 domain-containing protein [Micromonosporaceae bacterium]|nr:DUF1707 and DUF2154 domain-containing protein [Micromonosporaceae bacterium]